MAYREFIVIKSSIPLMECTHQRSNNDEWINNGPMRNRDGEQEWRAIELFFFFISLKYTTNKQQCVVTRQPRLGVSKTTDENIHVWEKRENCRNIAARIIDTMHPWAAGRSFAAHRVALSSIVISGSLSSDFFLFSLPEDRKRLI